MNLINIVLYLAAFYIVSNIFGLILEKIRIPKIYAALFLGVLLSTNTFVLDAVAIKPIYWLTQLGMFSLLLFLGFNLDIGQIKSQGKLIVNVTFWMISAEVLVGTLLLHFLLSTDWFLAAFISLSFATVGEVALLPILEEFKLVETQLGQSILGIGIMDDVVEIASFIILLIYISGFSLSDLLGEVLPILAILLGLLLKKLNQKLNLPKLNLEKMISVCGLTIFGPLFFFYAGTEANLNIFLQMFITILFMTLVLNVTKLVSVTLSSVHKLGIKKSIVMGMSLSIKFSTSIVIITILLQKGLISEELFSVLIGEKVLFKFITPVVLSILLRKWDLDLKKVSILNSNS